MFGGAVPGLRAVRRRATRSRTTPSAGWSPRWRAAPTPASLDGSPDEIAEVLWGSIHGLVMLELVGINPLAERSGRALRRVRSTSCSTGSAVADQLNQRGADAGRRRARPGLRRAVRRAQRRRARGSRSPAGPIGTGPGPAATSLGAFVAAATPLARRALAVASKSSKVATKAPLPSSKAIKIGLASLPIALRLSTTTRHGVREIQLLASYVITRSAGCRRRARPGPGALADPLALRRSRPAAEPRAAQRSRTAGAVARQWVLRSLGGDAESAVRSRARRQAEALDRLDLRELGPGLGACGTGAIDV